MRCYNGYHPKTSVKDGRQACYRAHSQVSGLSTEMIGVWTFNRRKAGLRAVLMEITKSCDLPITSMLHHRKQPVPPGCIDIVEDLSTCCDLYT